MSQTESRKHEHVDISLEKDVNFDHNYWDDIALKHNALPEVDKEEVDLSSSLFGKKLSMPLVIAGMTGGYKKAEELNDNLAAAAEEYQVGMGVGSQRAGLEKSDLNKTYSVIRNYDIPLVFANIGVSQLVLWDHEKSVEYANKMMDMVDADVLAVCLNFLQEVVQLEGEAHGYGCLEAIQNLVEDVDFPVLVKESGAGISKYVAKRLLDANVAGIDVGGSGGTSFAGIEHYRAKRYDDRLHARGGKTFWNWGVPTPISVMEVVDVAKDIPVVATGGIRNGLDVAKSLVLGADAAGVANVFLKAAAEGKDEILFELDAFYKELRAAMFLTGSSDVEQLRGNDEWVIDGVKLWSWKRN
ncbi:MAG: type 2 isopentenyl-diphosphate Delta-isomerase [Candidatus Thermoplasmatota archaeon]